MERSNFIGKSIRQVFLIACSFALGVCGLSAETPRPSFELASIRPFDRTEQPGHGSVAVSGSRITFSGYTLNALILWAYDMRAYQLSGGPGWMGSDTYTLVAKAEGDAARETAQNREMLQALLAERFGVKLHRETKESRVDGLMPGKAGHQLKESEARRTTMQIGPGHLMMAKATISQMAALLSSVLIRPVLDRTGIAGEFDFTLDSPDITMGRMQPTEELSGPSIFTAIQEQLGLKLESSKGPIDVVVVDTAAKPLEN